MDLEEVRLRQNRREFASDTRKGISESRARYSQIALRSTLGRPGPGLMLSKDMKRLAAFWTEAKYGKMRSEEHTSELQSRLHLVCRLLLETKKLLLSYTLACHLPN